MSSRIQMIASDTVFSHEKAQFYDARRERRFSIVAWWSFYSAIFFDLDGLLVNTEELHWKSYRDMCQQNGVDLPWDFDLYYSLASRSATGVELRLKLEYPQLFEKKSWAELYQEKRNNLRRRLQEDTIPLMPGVDAILESLQNADIPVAVVTHSPFEFVDHIRAQHSNFSSVQKWFARESYHNPKPAPDGYETAARFFGVDTRDCVGFEDSLRGIQSLTSAHVNPILVQKHDESSREWCQKNGICTLRTIDEILDPNIAHSIHEQHKKR